MPRKHPIIAVTGSSGAGTTSVQHAFAEIFRRLDIKAAYVHGDAFFRYNRDAMEQVINDSIAAGKPVSHFGPDTNLFGELETLFQEYSATGTGNIRHYVEDENDAAMYNTPIGEFTAWARLPAGSDLLFYEGLHGGVAAATWTRRRSSASHLPAHRPERRKGNRGVDVARHVDLLIGVVPVINLEWIQKIYRDCKKDNRTAGSVTATILRRMNDYIYFIVPQFSITDINFQRVPLVDTSNPFEAQDVPNADESVVIVHFRDPKRHDFPLLMDKIPGAYMSRANNMVVPGGGMAHAMEVICTPIIGSLL
jgi:phosphoribulokinase